MNHPTMVKNNNTDNHDHEKDPEKKAVMVDMQPALTDADSSSCSSSSSKGEEEEDAISQNNNENNNDNEEDLEGQGQATNDEESYADDLSTLGHPTGYLVLRPGNAKSPPLRNPRKVPNCCAVCLGEYEVDDTVVWSCNEYCKHAFHTECIMEWLLKIQDGGTPCPCCRQEFTSWETDRQERKIKWAAGSTFDVAAIQLR